MTGSAEPPAVHRAPKGTRRKSARLGGVRPWWAVAIWLGSIAAPAASFAAALEPAARPNILVIVADDLGYADLGAFGGEIDTPNLDSLALRGTRMAAFYTAPTCSPTRAMLMTGIDSHRVGLGTMAELLAPAQRGRPGYEGFLLPSAATLAEHLHAAGYRTLMSGKWHLGHEPGQRPASRGFDRSYALMGGAHDHYGDDQNSMWQTSGGGSSYWLDDRRTIYPRGKYSADQFTDKLIAFLKEDRRGTAPFFAYLAYTAPHWPLQAPADVVAKYRGRYDDGPAALRAERVERMKHLGLIGKDMPVGDLIGVSDWKSLAPAERAVEVRKMEIYAAMVDRLDWNVGRVLAALRRSGKLDNTLIIFLSDNGADGGVRTGPARVTDPALLASLHIDNSYANLGRRGSYISYGPAWAQAASPYRLYKSYTTEGGIRTPAFVAGPDIPSGRIEQGFAHVRDIAPTILELARARPLQRVAGRNALTIEGRSWVPVLRGRARSAHPDDEAVGWELFYRGAIRQGRWKAVYMPIRDSAPLHRAVKTSGWQLFDLAADPGETRDLADVQRQTLAVMIEHWTGYTADKGVQLPEE